jgi:hypothetical protein
LRLGAAKENLDSAAFNWVGGVERGRRTVKIDVGDLDWIAVNGGADEVLGTYALLLRINVKHSRIKILVVLDRFIFFQKPDNSRVNCKGLRIEGLKPPMLTIRCDVVATG